MNLIELRSEKTRKIICRLPSALVRWGISAVALVWLLLLAVMAFVPYPDTVWVQQGRIEAVHPQAVAVLLLPYGRVAQVAEGMACRLEVEGYPVATYGYVEGRITAVHPEALPCNEGHCLAVEVSLSHPSGISLQCGMAVGGSVMLHRATFMERLLR